MRQGIGIDMAELLANAKREEHDRNEHDTGPDINCPDCMDCASCRAEVGFPEGGKQ